MGVLDQVAEAKRRIDNLDVEAFKKELGREDVLVVDLRDPRERWRDGAIPGSRSVTRGMLEFWADPESPYYKPFFDKEKRTVLYCAGGLRSALAAAALKDLGFTDVAHLEGGFEAWADSGGEVEDIPVPSNLKG